MKQTPLPMVSGRYFFPKAPLLCLKWMPAWAVTSTNSIGPEGLEGAGFVSEAASAEGAGAEVGAGVGDGATAGGDAVRTSAIGFDLQPAARNESASKRRRHR